MSEKEEMSITPQDEMLKEHKLYKPVLGTTGEKIETLTFDFANLSNTINMRATTFLREQKYMPNPMGDTELMNLIGCEAAGLDLMSAFSLHVRDKIAVSNITNSFIYGDSEE